MSYQVLARKWRPRTFEQLVGQEHVSQALINGLDQDRLHHAFLFTGTRGIGKTTIARILAKCLNCETGVSSKPCGECGSCVDVDEGRFVDMIEIDAASRTGVDDMRELLESVQYTPTSGRYKVYIIDEVHMLSTHSFNALLKTLEEPPPHVKFVLATTDPEKIPVTILSRCLRFSLRRLLPDQIQAALETICESEKIDAETGALERIARGADGSMRDGLSLLDQAIAYGAGKLNQEEVERMLGLVEQRHIFELIEALGKGDANQVLKIIENIYAQACDPESVLTNLAETLHRISILHCVPEYRDRDRPDWSSIEDLSKHLSHASAQLYYQIAIKGAADLGLAPDPRTGLEMTLLRMLAFEPAKAGSPRSGSSPGGSGGDQQTKIEKSGHRAAVQRQVATGKEKNTKPKKRMAAGESKPAVEPRRRDDENDWISIIGQLPISGQVRELARNLHLQSAEGGNWSFAISPSLRHLGSKQCVDRLGQAISEQLGETVQISLTDSPDEDLLTAAGISEQSRHRKQTDAERAIEGDPAIKALKEQFDASIVEDSIQALQ
jgi:DNA polymerase-3 subunit gamma/tau